MLWKLLWKFPISSFFLSQMNQKTTKKPVGGTAPPHFLFLCPQPSPGNLLSMGHRSILSFPGTWDQRKSHVLSPLSPQFQVLFPSRMLNSWTFYPPLFQLDIPSALSIPGLSSRTWTDPGPALGFLNLSPNLISAWASLNSQTPCLGWWTHIFFRDFSRIWARWGGWTPSFPHLGAFPAGIICSSLCLALGRREKHFPGSWLPVLMTEWHQKAAGRNAGGKRELKSFGKAESSQGTLLPRGASPSAHLPGQGWGFPPNLLKIWVWAPWAPENSWF